MALLGSAAAAAEPAELVTDRPDQTESSVIVPRGHVQLETGLTTSEDEEGGVHVDTDEFLGTLVRIGLIERVELRLGWAGIISETVETPLSLMDSDESGVGDTELGAKVYLGKESGAAPETALLVGATLPTGEDAFSSDRVDPSFRLSFSHTLTDRLRLGYNVGAAWETIVDVGGDRDRVSCYLYTVALGIGLNDRLGAFVEVFGDVPGSAPGDPAHSLDGGLTYLLKDNLQLDLAGGIGLSDAATDWLLGVGVSARFPR